VAERKEEKMRKRKEKEERKKKRCYGTVTVFGAN